jgi:hypothetical protein
VARRDRLDDVEGHGIRTAADRPRRWLDLVATAVSITAFAAAEFGIIHPGEFALGVNIGVMLVLLNRLSADRLPGLFGSRDEERKP